MPVLALVVQGITPAKIGLGAAEQKEINSMTKATTNRHLFQAASPNTVLKLSPSSSPGNRCEKGVGCGGSSSSVYSSFVCLLWRSVFLAWQPFTVVPAGYHSNGAIGSRIPGILSASTTKKEVLSPVAQWLAERGLSAYAHAFALVRGLPSITSTLAHSCARSLALFTECTFRCFSMGTTVQPVRRC